ncbi:MAG: GNAT family N-acetyltransferase [Gammaproteobacteria bacterium]
MKITPPSPRLRAEWRDLYFGYAAFYRTPPPDFDIVWKWLAEGALRGLGAADETGALRGIAHWEKILRPLHSRHLAYLHDLFVAPEMRGRGVGRQLILAAADAAKAEGCATMRWATAADNRAAMRLYDRVADKTSWVIYERKSEAGTESKSG